MFNLKDRLRRTRESFMTPLKSVFARGGKLSDEDAESIEELLLGADVGVEACEKILDALRESRDADPRALIRAQFLELLADVPCEAKPSPHAVVVIGVNGVGKTTSIAKLAHLYRSHGQHVILAACDTFRAAAADQLGIWAERIGVDMIRHQDGGDPAAVAFDACSAAKARGADVVIVDTAGRLHTKINLMEELAKIRRVCTKVLGDDRVETLVALDANLGQNSLAQAEGFSAQVGADGVILTKLDSTARGGIVIAVRQRLGLPVRYIGVGEQLDDFAEFSAEAFVDALLG